MDDERSGRVVAGVVLVVIGLGLVAVQLVDGLGGSVWLFSIGALFLAGYFYRRSYGLLVPGAILLGIALGQVGDRAFGALDGTGSIGLGVGFLAIYVIDRAYQGQTAWWPLIPGGILVVTGLASIGDPFSEVVQYAWPLALIAVGLVLIFGVTKARRRS